MSKNSKQNILIVDDDPDILTPLSQYLQNNGYAVSAAKNAAEARRSIKKKFFDLVLLDVMMPGETGLQFCSELRLNSNVPVIFLTSKTEDIDRVLGLEIGADDYVGKPFLPRELLARISAVLRRSSQPAFSAPVTGVDRYQFSEWTYDGKTRNLSHQSGKNFTLPTKESRLLLTFLKAPNTELSRFDLLQSVYGYENETVFDRSIDTLISRLRRKLGAVDTDLKLILTVWGSGYIFTSPVTSAH